MRANRRLLAGVEEIAGGSMEADGEKLRNMGSEAHAARLCEEVVAQGFPAPRRRLLDGDAIDAPAVRHGARRGPTRGRAP